VVLLCRIPVNLGKKNGDRRSARMDCDCAMIEYLYDFAPGRCTCAITCFGVHIVCIGYALFMLKVCNECAYQSILATPMHRRVPAWWKEAGVSGMKQLYQPEKPVVYIVSITSILGRLPLIPTGDHCTHSCGAERPQAFRCWGNATRTGGRAPAAGSTTSARGPCAGPPTTQRSQ
jgi:hypothetical protein